MYYRPGDGTITLFDVWFTFLFRMLWSQISSTPVIMGFKCIPPKKKTLGIFYLNVDKLSLYRYTNLYNPIERLGIGYNTYKSTWYQFTSSQKFNIQASGSAAFSLLPELNDKASWIATEFTWKSRGWWWIFSERFGFSKESGFKGEVDWL